MYIYSTFGGECCSILLWCRPAYDIPNKHDLVKGWYNYTPLSFTSSHLITPLYSCMGGWEDMGAMESKYRPNLLYCQHVYSLEL